MTTDPAGSIGSPGGVFRRVLVGFDGSAQAQHALRIAIALAADLQGEAHVLLVVRPPAHAETAEDLAAAADAERDALSRGLSRMLSQAPRSWRLAADVVIADDPATAIAQHAERHGFDLIVVGAHGREQMTHRGIGRSLQALLRDKPCPVLVV